MSPEAMCEAACRALEGWLAGGPAKMAATNKCLARSNKSPHRANATKKQKARDGILKYSNPMSLAELCRADRFSGQTPDRRDRPDERRRKRARLEELAKEGKVEKVGPSSWRAIYQS
jgi:hypothetical protein